MPGAGYVCGLLYFVIVYLNLPLLICKLLHDMCPPKSICSYWWHAHHTIYPGVRLRLCKLRDNSGRAFFQHALAFSTWYEQKISAGNMLWSCSVCVFLVLFFPAKRRSWRRWRRHTPRFSSRTLTSTGCRYGVVCCGVGWYGLVWYGP